MAGNNLENYQESDILNLEEYVGELSSLKDDVINKSKESKEYDKYPYISEHDYKKYFAPETYNFRQFEIGSCRFVASIFGITQLESYKNLIKNSVKKDEKGNFIIKIPLSTEKNNIGTWHKIDISVYQNQMTINGMNPQILQNAENKTDSGNGIVALAMAIGEEVTQKVKFDINRLEGGDPAEIFLNGRVINGITLEEKINHSDIKIQKLKLDLLQKNTLVIAFVNEKNDGSFGTVTGKNDKSNHGIVITKIINEDNNEYIQYYDPNYYELNKITIDDFLKQCWSYEIFCENKTERNFRTLQREKSYQDEENRNSAGMVVENTKKRNDTLRNLRGDFITYQDDNITVVESRGKRAEIVNDVPPMGYHMTVTTESGKIIGEDSGEFVTLEIYDENPYRCINFSNSNVRLYVDTSKLSNKYKGKKDEQYKEHLYLPKIANFMNRMIYNYIDTESRNKENPAPFSINKLGDLVFDDNPYNVSLDQIESSEKENMEEKWKERKEEKQKPWNDKLVCLRDRSTLGINDKETKQQIVSALNYMVGEVMDK